MGKELRLRRFKLLISPEKVDTVGMFEYGGKDYKLKHGSVVIAAITSCTNTSNPSVMLGAGK